MLPAAPRLSTETLALPLSTRSQLVTISQKSDTKDHKFKYFRAVTSNLAELAEWLNPVIRGWMNYYGKFYRTEMFALLRRINTYIMRWARRKFKRLRAFKRAKRWWNGLLQREPQLFVHWAWMPEF